MKSLKIILSVFLCFCAFCDGGPSEESILVVKRPEKTYIPAVHKWLADFRDDQIVAVVNEQSVLFSEIRAWFSNMIQNHTTLYPELVIDDAIISNFKKVCLDKVVLKYVLKSEIDKLNLWPSDEQLKERTDIFKSHFPGELEFERYIASNGLSKEEFSKQLRFQMGIDKLLAGFDSEVKPFSKRKLKKWKKEHKEYFIIPERIRFSMIMVKYEQGDEEGKQKNLNFITGLRNDIVSGKKTIKDLAKNFSDHAPSRQKDGDYGWVDVKELQEMFLPLNNYKEGVLTPVFVYVDCFYFARITAKEPQKEEKFKDVIEKVKKLANGEAIQKNRNRHIEGLQKQAVVNILLS